jgi:hypothetical protein
MKLPFSVDEFFHVFKVYNESVWPAQLVLYALAIATAIIALMGGQKSSQIVFFILAIFWIWAGSIYHIEYFSAINNMAYFFGSIFIVQGIIFLYFGVFRIKVEFKFQPQISHILGVVLIVYSLLIYRVIGYYQGHIFPEAPTFGVPCPTTIFTFGILLLTIHRVPWYMFIIPFLWSLVGFSAAVNLSVSEDYGLVVAGILATVLLLFNKKMAPKRSGQARSQNQTAL